MPEIVNGIYVPRPRIKPAGQQNEREASRASQCKAASFVLAAPIAQENKTYRESEKGKCRPGKDRKQPRLGLAEIVHAVDVGLQRPWHPARAPCGP